MIKIKNDGYHKIITNKILKELEKLSRRYIIDPDIEMENDYYVSLSIAKFILLKEFILKKNSKTSKLTFDIDKNIKYVDSILNLYSYIKKQAKFDAQEKINIIGEIPKEIDENELKNALWAINKIRDSFAHENNRYNEILQIVEVSDKTLTDDENEEQEEVIEEIKEVKEDDESKSTIVCRIPLDVLNKFYYGNLKDNSREKMKAIVNHLSIFLYNDMVNENLKALIDKLNEKEKERITEGFNIYLNNENINDNLTLDEINFLDFEKFSNIFKQADLEHKEKIIEGIIKSSYYVNIDDKILYKSKEEFLIDFIFWHFKSSLQIVNNRKKNFGKEILLREIDGIFKGEETSIPEESLIILYLYSFLVLSSNENIDYQHLKAKNLNIDFKGDYISDINQIIKICKKYNEEILTMKNNLLQVEDEELRKRIVKKNLLKTSKLVKNIMLEFDKKNERIVKSVRNALAHGNFYELDDDNICLIDKNDQSNDETIKFRCVTSQKELYKFCQSTNRKDLEKKYTISTFMNELSNVIDKDLYEETKNNMIEALSYVGININVKDQVSDFIEKGNQKVK